MHHATKEHTELKLQTIWGQLPHMPVLLRKYYVMYEFNTEVQYDLREIKLLRHNTNIFMKQYCIIVIWN
jgi:hypothetical protein